MPGVDGDGRGGDEPPPAAPAKSSPACIAGIKKPLGLPEATCLARLYARGLVLVVVGCDVGKLIGDVRGHHDRRSVHAVPHEERDLQQRACEAGRVGPPEEDVALEPAVRGPQRGARERRSCHARHERGAVE